MEWLTKCERMAALETKLEEISRGGRRPTDRDDLLGLAEVCHDKKQYAAAADFCEVALAADPARANDLESWERYNAACDAALAGDGQGKDGEALDEKARSRWRQKALDWLREDLALWTKRAGDGGPGARSAIREAMEHWLQDDDLVGIRERGKLAGMIASERSALEALWAEVRSLLARTTE